MPVDAAERVRHRQPLQSLRLIVIEAEVAFMMMLSALWLEEHEWMSTNIICCERLGSNREYERRLRGESHLRMNLGVHLQDDGT